MTMIVGIRNDAKPQSMPCRPCLMRHIKTDAIAVVGIHSAVIIAPMKSEWKQGDGWKDISNTFDFFTNPSIWETLPPSVEVTLSNMRESQ